jgi:hypothetical protein
MVTRSLTLAAVLVTACTDTSRWNSEPGESFCGDVTAASFVRAGVPEGMRMRLELDAERLQSTPGRLWTTALPSGDKLTGAEMRVIPQVLHDPLSTLSFGEGRVRNAIAVADLPSADPARPSSQLIVIVSLLQSGEVEVRLLRGALGSVPSDAGPADPTGNLFGVFRLRREKGDCGIP